MPQHSTAMASDQLNDSLVLGFPPSLVALSPSPLSLGLLLKINYLHISSCLQLCSFTTGRGKNEIQAE